MRTNDSGWVFCGFHNTIICWLPSISQRICTIKETKSEKEIPIRLANLKLVRGDLPKGVVKARDARDKAWDACVEAWDACVKVWDAYGKTRDARDKAWDAYVKARDARDKAQDAYDKALILNMPAIRALHEKECPDSNWNWDKMELDFALMK